MNPYAETRGRFAARRAPLGARTGAGSRRASGLGGCGCRTIGDLNADVAAKLQAQASQLASQGAAKLQAATGVTVNTQTAQGVTSAADLAQNGFNPDDPADRAKLIHAISGGLAMIPGAGLILAGAVETLAAVGNAIACPVTHLFGGTSPDCGDPPCTHSGADMTPSTVLAMSQPLNPPRGSFAELVSGALALHSADAWSCKGSVGADAIVVACANVWNASHAGPAVPVYVPPLDMRGVSSRGIWPGLSSSWWSPGFAAGAFQPITPGGLQSMIMQIQAAQANPWRPGGTWGMAEAVDPATSPTAINVNQGPLVTRTVSLRVGGSGGAKGRASGVSSPTGPSSGGGGAVVGLVAAGAAAGLGWWLTQSVSGKRVARRLGRRLGRKR